MKKFLSVITTVICVVLMLTLAACEGGDGGEVPSAGADKKTLIVYFTAEHGNTENLANYIHSQIGGDIVKSKRLNLIRRRI